MSNLGLYKVRTANEIRLLPAALFEQRLPDWTTGDRDAIPYPTDYPLAVMAPCWFSCTTLNNVQHGRTAWLPCNSLSAPVALTASSSMPTTYCQNIGVTPSTAKEFTHRVGTGGYGISWNDEIDLSESEL